MNRTMGVTLVVVLVAALAVGIYFMLGSGNIQSQQSTQNTQSAAESANAASTGSASGSSSSSDTQTITIDASRFKYSPNVIQLKQGEHVKLIINNMDTTHGISIPDFGVQGLGSVEFTADKVGTFQFHCPTYCGSGHSTMTGTIVVSA